MGKSKKSKSGQPSRFRVQPAQQKQAFDPKASRVKRLETAEDAFGGDEDEFHKNRDAILFEDDGAGDRDMNDLSSDDEVYGLDLPAEKSDDDEDMGEGDDEEYLSEDEDEETVYSTDKASAEEPRGRFAKSSDLSQDLPSDASDAEEEEEAYNSSDEEETWAAGQYHASRRAPGEADSEDDEVADLEVEEARRLQKKARGEMAGEDYGFGAEEEDEGELEKVRQKARGKGRLEDAAEDGEKAVEGKKWTEEEAIAHLLKKSPETLALLDDFTATAERIKGVEKNLEIVRLGDEDGREHPALAIMELEHQALATYLPTLAFYFSLLLSPSPSADLLAKVLARLSSLRQALATMEELDLTSAQYEDSGDEEEESVSDEGVLASNMWDEGGAQESDEEIDEEEDMRMLAEADGDEASEEDDSEIDENVESMLGGLDDDELEALMASMPADADADMFIRRVEQVQREKNGLPPLDDDEEPPSAFDNEEMDDYEMNDIIGESTSSKKNKKKKGKKSKEIVVPELAPLASSSRKIASLPATSSTNVNDDYLDPTSLSLTDSSDKASNRHSLRFHVSQVKQKAAKRESGHGRRIGGDDDLPRRSKENARREVLKRQEHGAVGDGKGEALDGGEWTEEDRKAARGVKGQTAVEEVEGEDYYDMVKQGQEQERSAKKAKYDGDRLEEKAANIDLATSLADGPRGATRQILANKGLQPKRAKINRNPRVKKRMAYDKAVKKVATMKSVYKAGGDRSDYGGEKSGIGAKVVKSVRLGGA